ncbi:MAG: TlpA family protein disulfide reductase [Bacteroidaceae bacterium]|nr:TlpA family protein disulfide reductase [Bacteroidaceae bacterium]
MKKIFALVAVLAMLTTISCNQAATKPEHVALSDSAIEAKLQPLYEKIQNLPEDGNEDKAIKQLALDFIKDNENEAGVYVIQSLLAFTMPVEELIEFVDGNEYFKNDSTIIEAKKTWNVQLETGEGKMFKDFETEYEGKVTKLSDYVGKGKYVLVDFWASWCGPCRMEIPNLIAVYNKYKGEKFEVLGVATWDEPDATKQAIEELGIPYPQMLNAQKAGSDAYGISGIPQIILFAPDGKIVKRDLRGEEIEKAVADVLK